MRFDAFRYIDYCDKVLTSEGLTLYMRIRVILSYESVDNIHSSASDTFATPKGVNRVGIEVSSGCNISYPQLPLFHPFFKIVPTHESINY